MAAMAPCGTYSAYRRHLRRGEPVDEACRQAQKDRDKGRRKKDGQRRFELRRLIASPDSGGERLIQMVAVNSPQEVAVGPTMTPLEAARWREKRIRAAMLVATPRDVAPLAKAHEEAMSAIAALSGETAGKKVNALDQLAAQRARRLAKATG